jgi:hypothetical protein
MRSPLANGLDTINHNILMMNTRLNIKRFTGRFIKPKS